eukprot:TRINITY_DN1127_c0_g1_i2.p1 TRINITY_DN1127_c0_g1~~TRINITY_DN1127_c0_g1_i2.p1  ORF type:complete len:143 (-),score=40.60 TRINITY_DN1127_c0_g1_i2:65-493(-)
MIGNSFKIREFFDRADSLSSNDPTVKHALGKWSYKIANIGWAERTVASALFASPPTATFEDALPYFLACEELVVGKVRYQSIASSNYLMLGQTYEGLKNTEKAKEYYNKCIALPLEGAGVKVQEVNQKLAKERIAAIGSSWW